MKGLDYRMRYFEDYVKSPFLSVPCPYQVNELVHHIVNFTCDFSEVCINSHHELNPMKQWEN